jgi:predicted RNA-binding Zn ribbon-like protein
MMKAIGEQGDEALEARSKQVAPGELELVRQFLNTHDVEDEIDEIATPAALSAWLAEHGLPQPGADATDADVRRTGELRESLRALLLANNGEPVEADAVESLNELAEDLRLVVRFDGAGGSALEPADRGVDAALGALLAIVVRSMAAGTWGRLKACRADTCQWAFYDHSKNRSGTWCSMAVCGNRAKARAYRERQSTGG